MPCLCVTLLLSVLIYHADDRCDRGACRGTTNCPSTDTCKVGFCRTDTNPAGLCGLEDVDGEFQCVK